MNGREEDEGTLPVVTASTSSKTVTVIKGSGSRQQRSSYTFDNVFASMSTQKEVFESTLKPVISDVMSGYESTVFAYGQTGTGKTHTMEGDISNSTGSEEVSAEALESEGIIPRSAREIFKRLLDKKYVSSEVSCSYLEIYNEELSDLLCYSKSAKADSHKLEILESKTGPYCKGLSTSIVTSADDVLTLMTKAQRQRKIGETKMNKQSSRSHCLFTIAVKATVQYPDGNMQFNGKLHMVDLAGSECAKSADLDTKDKASASRERERMNINRSLLSLGRVISCLKEQSEKKNSSVRIPYRDSKLTRILQESLGGRCKTVIIATLSPSVTAIEESVSTLNYAQSANGIINKPVSTSYLSVGRGAANVAAGSGDAPGNGASLEYWHEMECRLEYMKGQVEEAQGALARKHLQQQQIEERAEKAEQARDEAEEKLKEQEKINAELQLELREEVKKRQLLNEQLSATKKLLEQTRFILKATQDTEHALTREALDVVDVLKSSIVDGDSLHKKLCDHAELEKRTREVALKFREQANGILTGISGNCYELNTLVKEGVATIEKEIGGKSVAANDSLGKIVEMVTTMNESVSAFQSTLKSQLQDDVVSSMNEMKATMASSCEKATKVIETAEEKLVSQTTETIESLESTGRDLSSLNAKLTESSESFITSTKKEVDRNVGLLESTKSKINEMIVDVNGKRMNVMGKLTDSINTLDTTISTELDGLIGLAKNHQEIAVEQQMAAQASFLERVLNGMSKVIESETTAFGNTMQASIQEGFGELKNKCEHTKESVSKQINDVVMSNLKEVKKVDSVLSSELTDLGADVSEHVGYVEGEFTSAINSGFADVRANATKSTSFASEMIAQTAESINKTMSDRSGHSDAVVNEIDGIQTQVSNSVKSLNTITNAIVTFGSKVAATSVTTNKEITTEAEKEQTENANFATKCSEILNDSVINRVEGEIKKTKEAIREAEAENERFVVNDLNAEEDVEEVVRRTEFNVKEDFSKTGSEEEVLANFVAENDDKVTEEEVTTIAAAATTVTEIAKENKVNIPSVEDEDNKENSNTNSSIDNTPKLTLEKTTTKQRRPSTARQSVSGREDRKAQPLRSQTARRSMK